MGLINLAPLKQYVFFVENPVTGDDIPRHRTPRDFHVKEIIALLIGGGLATFDWTVGYSASANDVGAGTTLETGAAVTNNTTGVTYSPPFDPGDPAIIPAGNYLWLALSAVSTGIARPVAAQVLVYGVEKGP